LASSGKKGTRSSGWQHVCRCNLTKTSSAGADLPWADLLEANLSGADLSRANLSGADMSRANLSRANLRVIGVRSDSYIFHLYRHEDGALMLRAGCRYFSLTDARAHWAATRAGTPLGEESLALVDHAERMAKIAGWL
jgi:hypothetical protein